MPEIAVCILLALLEYENGANEFEISASSGYATGGSQSGGFWRILRAMLRAGLVIKPWAGLWFITERGKIALAIEMGCRTKQRYHGRRVNRRGWRLKLESMPFDGVGTTHQQGG